MGLRLQPRAYRLAAALEITLKPPATTKLATTIAVHIRAINGLRKHTTRPSRERRSDD